MSTVPASHPRLTRVVSTAQPGLWRRTFGLVVPSASASFSRPSSTSVVDVRASSADVDVVSSVRPGDVLRFTLVDDDAREDDADDGRDDDTRAHKEVRFLEVTATTATTAIGRCRGRRCALEISANETFVTYEESKEVSKTDESLINAFPEWMTLLEALATRERYPRRRETGARRCEDVVRVKSLDALRADVDEDASFWVDGSSKDFKGLSADERALLNAGELVAFQRGRRPMCMVQLWTGWNDDEVGDQNIDLPYVVRLLREVIEDEKIEAITTAPPNATDAHGLTALVFPNRSPYRERAEFLASFGAQAALVAGSPYYQTLIGRCLGYKEENVEAHVRQYNRGAPISKRVSDSVDEELRRISPVPPTKNWREDFPEIERKKRWRKKKKSKRRTSSVEDVEMMFGRRRNR
jgi:hypothetical protein|tara:strand:- start:1665 stop:2897 length:1233 start_codon:yes stop_codon:yes gene_type:complete